jgi:hypothetical protein
MYSYFDIGQFTYDKSATLKGKILKRLELRAYPHTRTKKAFIQHGYLRTLIKRQIFFYHPLQNYREAW